MRNTERPADLPLVSIVVITRDRREEVLACLDNVCQQDYPNKQVVVIDNGSSDGSVDAIERGFSEIRVLALEYNAGVSGGRNRGVELADGEICIFIDDDARFRSRDATLRAVEYFRSDPRLAVVGFRIINSSTGLDEHAAIPRADKRILDEDYSSAYFCGTGFALRRTPFIDLGMFWEPLVYSCEELDLSYRLLDAGYRIIRSAVIEVEHNAVPLARPKGQWIYFNARNRTWVAIRSLPWLYVVTTSVIWWCHTGVLALRSGQVRFWLQGVRDAVRDLPKARHGRSLIRRDTLRDLRHLSGRLWF